MAIPKVSAVSARAATYLLSGFLALITTILVVRAPAGSLLMPDLPEPVTLVSLLVMFILASKLMLHIEFRRQAYSMTLEGVPTVFAILLAPGHAQVLTRVAASVIALLIQRQRLEKVVFNVTNHGFQIACVGAVVPLLHGHAGFGLHAFLLLLGAMVVVDAVVTTLILGVIRIHGVPLGRADLIGALLPTLVVAVATTSFASAIVLLVEHGGSLGVLLVVLGTAVAALTYRDYTLTHKRHESLELVHDFVADGVGAQSVDSLAQQLLSKIRTLLRADTAELIIFDPERGAGDTETGRRPRAPESPALRLTVGYSAQLRVVRYEQDATDWMLLRARSSGEPILLARNSKDPGVVSWLAGRGVRDALVVPLPASHAVSGVVVVSNRLGETATFTDDDKVLLHTLTRHLAVALHSTRLVERLTYDANHDSLTGLANRAYLNRQIHSAVMDDTGQAAVLLLDLDRFKEVNDTLGHEAGDQLLMVVAERLRSVVPAEATVARLGGDEFALLVPRHVGGRVAALTLAHAISDTVRQPVHFDEAHLSPQVSIGVALTGSGTDLLRQADTAMYSAKASDIPAVLYTPEMDRQRLERLALLADLRVALQSEPEQFTVYYQPKVNLSDGAVTSLEALVRWRHPIRGMVAPDDFISLAESTGLIQQLTPIVLDAALAECSNWAANGHRVSVAVNLSARNVEDARLPIRVAESLRRHRVPARRLILEITESSVMGDPDQTVPVLHELNKLGLELSLDDFGTGYSSLSYLQQLPVQEVKVDRSFVMGLASPNPASSRALIQSITGLGKNLGLRVVAEGVETEAQLNELRELGCDVAQGYHISRPLPAEAVLGWLRATEQTALPRLRLLALGE
jgi:diguanylate cyclase (GGDEF)-like protein